MPRLCKYPPYPKRPHASGQARITIRGRPVYLGPFGSPESWAEYERHLAEWRVRQAEAASAPAAGPAEAVPVITVAHLLARWWAYAREHYRTRDGRPKKELAGFRFSLAPLARLYGHVSVRDLGPLALKAVLRSMVDGAWMSAAERARAEKQGRGIGWCRRVCNRALTRMKTMFRWAQSEQLLPAGRFHDLATVHGLREEEHGVRELPEVPPVPEEDLAKTLPQLWPVVREVVELLLLTGARPSELLKLTPGDVNRSGEVEIAKGYKVKLGAGVWAYQPHKHKTAYRGHRRVILFGPRAQAILVLFLEGRAPDAPLFSPREAQVRRFALRRQRRRSRVQPSQKSRAKARPRKAPGERYDVGALTQAIKSACRRAGVPTWTAYRLRHSAATRLLAQFGWEVTRIILGHKHVQTTQIYALESLEKAAQAVNEAS